MFQWHFSYVKLSKEHVKNTCFNEGTKLRPVSTRISQKALLRQKSYVCTAKWLREKIFYERLSIFFVSQVFVLSCFCER